MPDDDASIGQGIIDERNEARRNAYRGFGTRFEPQRTGYPSTASAACRNGAHDLCAGHRYIEWNTKTGRQEPAPCECSCHAKAAAAREP